jgi:hypothetical protein
VVARFGARLHAPGMFTVSIAEATMIQTTFARQGMLSAAIDMRRLFSGVTDSVEHSPGHCLAGVAASP